MPEPQADMAKLMTTKNAVKVILVFITLLRLLRAHPATAYMSRINLGWHSSGPIIGSSIIGTMAIFPHILVMDWITGS